MSAGGIGSGFLTLANIKTIFTDIKLASVRGLQVFDITFITYIKYYEVLPATLSV